MTPMGKVALGYAISRRTDTFIPRPDDWEDTINSNSDEESDNPTQKHVKVEKTNEQPQNPHGKIKKEQNENIS